MADLGTALRDLTDAAVRTEVPAGELAAVAAAARELTARLRAVGRGVHEVASVDDPVTGERWYSPVHGPGNPVAPAVAVGDTPDGRATARVTVGKPHEGPPGLVHGGVVATLLDHVLARAVRAAGRGGLTATLTVHYRRPVPLGVPLLLTAEAGESAGRRSTATARLVAEDAPDTVLAEADGLFITLRPERAAEVFPSLADPAGTWTARTGDAGA
ncbi:PaaI family thioesterase [Geodermatophilus sp. DSM 44513]|uniref:PaaI family thioesterase n=1 Tax=Geodermatophilus sp. DSM 44513 TaxID=1528104 RepID=UPI001279F9ED|nr:PaaI family thioesterase [Geodermatophilus sp. DSM 44513]WNV76780.1 PaaI family thioesterase [Geodermatophilus sp. DSM 44513]